MFPLKWSFSTTGIKHLYLKGYNESVYIWQKSQLVIILLESFVIIKNLPFYKM